MTGKILAVHIFSVIANGTYTIDPIYYDIMPFKNRNSEDFFSIKEILQIK